MGSCCAGAGAAPEAEASPELYHPIEHSQFILDNVGQITDFYESALKKERKGKSKNRTDISWTSSNARFQHVTNKATGMDRMTKIVRKGKIKNVASFKQEVDTMKAMDHPNIVKLHETFEDKKNIYFVLEHLSGGEFFDHLVSKGGLTETESATLMEQILRPVSYMHARHICHRDIKPDNFYFLNQGPVEGNQLKLVDFGAACKFQPGKRMTNTTGTPYYVAAEVLAGSYTEKCDLWSCGVVLYVMLCGSPPFTGTKDHEVLNQVRAGVVSFRESAWKSVSDDAKDLVRKLILKDPKARYSGESALGHTWIKNAAPRAAQGAALAGDWAANIRRFRSQNVLQRAVSHIIAHQLADEHIQALRETFTRLDKNGDGLLPYKEITEALQAHVQDGAPAGLKQLFQDIDTDGDGVIEYSEFLAAALDERFQQQEDLCWSAFRLFDRDGDGKISLDEIKFVLKTDDVAEAMGAKAVEDVLKSADTNGDGAIDFEEFMAMMRRQVSTSEVAGAADAEEPP